MLCIGNGRACERYADKNFLGYRGTESGPFKYVTYKEFGRMVNQVSEPSF